MCVQARCSRNLHTIWMRSFYKNVRFVAAYTCAACELVSWSVVKIHFVAMRSILCIWCLFSYVASYKVGHYRFRIGSWYWAFSTSRSPLALSISYTISTHWCSANTLLPLAYESHVAPVLSTRGYCGSYLHRLSDELVNFQISYWKQNFCIHANNTNIGRRKLLKACSRCEWEWLHHHGGFGGIRSAEQGRLTGSSGPIFYFVAVFCRSPRGYCGVFFLHGPTAWVPIVVWGIKSENRGDAKKSKIRLTSIHKRWTNVLFKDRKIGAEFG